MFNGTVWNQGTIYRNAQIRYTQIVYCTQLIYQVRAKTYDFWLSGQYGKHNINIFLFHPLGPYRKWCVAPEFFVLISSTWSTQIWRIRYGGSWSIYFLFETNKLLYILLWKVYLRNTSFILYFVLYDWANFTFWKCLFYT